MKIDFEDKDLKELIGIRIKLVELDDTHYGNK